MQDYTRTSSFQHSAETLAWTELLAWSYALGSRDIKPANLLANLKGEPKITDFGISAGLEDSVAMVSHMNCYIHVPPERIRNENYSPC
ncbi:Mitogen-activated protein kinase kinase 3 [Salvia divinorum]|uniref:mitogen-activated protein kinase kinase n=1 Tax=Salvia divinorum TaxID=28513 RepID=A0ABD1GBL6_SALDI